MLRTLLRYMYTTIRQLQEPAHLLGLASVSFSFEGAPSDSAFSRTGSFSLMKVSPCFSRSFRENQRSSAREKEKEKQATNIVVLHHCRDEKRQQVVKRRSADGGLQWWIPAPAAMVRSCDA